MQNRLLHHLSCMRLFLLSPLTLLLILSGLLPAFGQVHPVPAATSNAAWLDSVQRLPLLQQVVAVQARAWRDTLLAPYHPPVCRIILPATARPPMPPVPVRPGFPLLYVVDEQIFFHNDPATIRALQRVLTTRPIRQVTLLHAEAATALYGSRGVHGVVWLSNTKAKRR